MPWKWEEDFEIKKFNFPKWLLLALNSKLWIGLKNTYLLYLFDFSFSLQPRNLTH